MSSVHSPSNLLPICLLGGSLAAAVVYFYWTSTPSRKLRGKSARGVPGLYNLGNTCYANALLQGLASIPSFVRWLENIDLSSTDLHDGFVKELRELILQLNDGTLPLCSAGAVTAALAQHKWNITIGVEHDLHELFNVFVTTWEEELNHVKNTIVEGSLLTLTSSSPPPSPLVKRPSGSGDASSDDRNTSKQRVGLVFQRCVEAVQLDAQLRAPCFGLVATKLQCCQTNCGFKKVRQDRLSVISLTIPKSFNGMRITIESLLRKYFCMEVIRGATCDICKEKKGKVDSGLLKKQGLSKLPQTLVIRIERVGVLPSGNVFKLTDHVDFAETLDVRDLCFYRSKEDEYTRATLKKDYRSPEATSRIVGGAENYEMSRLSRASSGISMDRNYAVIDGGSFVAERREAAKYSYQLRAVSEHRGIPETGHFVTYRRGLDGKEHNWYLTNDSQVTCVPYQQVINAQAYMLYYERIQTNRWYKNNGTNGNQC